MEDARPRKRRRLRGWAARDLLHAQIRQQARVMQPVTWISLFVVAVAAAFVALVALESLRR